MCIVGHFLNDISTVICSDCKKWQIIWNMKYLFIFWFNVSFSLYFQLLCIYPDDNSLGLVYRDKESMGFVKYINSRASLTVDENGGTAPKTEPVYFYDIKAVYYEWCKSNQETWQYGLYIKRNVSMNFCSGDALGTNLNTDHVYSAFYSPSPGSDVARLFAKCSSKSPVPIAIAHTGSRAHEKTKSVCTCLQSASAC